MNLLFISYWSYHDGLTQGTVIPNLQVLRSISQVKTIVLCTIERDHEMQAESTSEFIHVPLFSRNYRSVVINKINDYITFSREIRALLRTYDIKIVICRSSLAGSLGYLATRFTEIPFIVESFEPHAEYMRESGVWYRYDVRYVVEKIFERLQLSNAKFLISVATAYQQELESRGVSPKKMVVVPCVIDRRKFRRQPNDIRKMIGIKDDATVGIYAGKFGGLYLSQEAFAIFRQAANIFEKFFLIILSPNEKSSIERLLRNHGFSEKDFYVGVASHDDVPKFLSASDLAFATYKPSPSKRFLSPIKVGEYWACGLPVLLTDAIGDDADIINDSNCGATFLLNDASVCSALKKIKDQLTDATIRERCIRLAEKYRAPSILKNAYLRILGLA
jgi:glycosyltransferase involved in cell wall biosynthesis